MTQHMINILALYEEDTPRKTRVIFRVFKDHNDVIALFPDDVFDSQGNIASYMHVGQHAAADYTGVMRATRAASMDEYKSLKTELEKHVGYDLEIVSRKE